MNERMSNVMTRRDTLAYIGRVGLKVAYATLAMSVLDKVGAFEAWVDEVLAAELPKNYQTIAGTRIIDTSTGTAGITVSGVETGSATWSVSEITTPYYLRPRLPTPPTKVIKLTATSAVGGSYRMEWTVSVKPRDIGHFWFLVFAENLGGVTNNASILFSDTGSYTNRYSFGYNFTSIDEGVWRDVHIPFSLLSVAAGSPDPNATFTRLRLVFGAASTKTPTYYVCPVWVNRASKPVFTFSFDDKATEDFTNAYAYMQPRGLVGSLAITSGSGALSVANMQTMQSNGWSIHNHTHTHPSMPSLTEAQMVTEIETCQQYMIRNGLNSGPSAFVYPFGTADAASNAVVNRYYPYSFLANSATARQPLFDGIQNPNRILRATMDMPVSSATLIANINNAVNTGHSMNLYGHVVAAGAPTGQIDLTVFQAVCNHIMRLRDSNVIQQRNLETMLAGLNYPRRLRAA